jgi:CheY-like chemotaxis protein
MAKPLRVLFVEDNPDDAELLVRALKKEGYDPVHRRVETDHELRLALLNEEWDIVLCDWAIPGFEAPAALEVVQSSHREVPFVIVSGTVDEETAVAAMRSGAHDFLVKGNLRRLSPIIERELAESQIRRERNRVEGDLRNREVMLATIGGLAERLVRVEEIDAVVREVLQAIGEATGADRAFLYRHRLPRPEGPVLSSLACEWVGPRGVPRTGDPALQDMVWSEMGMAEGAAALERGETVQLLARDLTGPLHRLTYISACDLSFWYRSGAKVHGGVRSDSPM